MTTSSNFTQVTSGQTVRTVTTSFSQGSGFTVRVFDSWRGEENSEVFFSNQRWFNTEEESVSEMNRMVNEFRNSGWN